MHAPPGVRGMQRDVERRPHLHGEGEPVRNERHREGEDEAPEPRIGRRARIGNHEEREEQQRTALETVKRNRDKCPMWLSLIVF